jgi:hypothetical protein
MSLATVLNALTNQINQFYAEIVTALGKKTAASFQSQNSSKLNGRTLAQAVSDATTALATHASNKANPHTVTAAQVGAYDQAGFDAVFNLLLPSGILPISRFGTLDTAPVPTSFLGWVFSTTAAIPLIMAGGAYTLPVISVDMSTLFPGAYANRTFYVYVRLIGGVPSLLISASQIAETITNMYLGTLTTGTSTIATVTLKKVTRLDTFRVSNLPIGSAIPVSNGTPDAPATLAWST